MESAARTHRARAATITKRVGIRRRSGTSERQPQNWKIARSFRSQRWNVRHERRTGDLCVCTGVYFECVLFCSETFHRRLNGPCRLWLLLERWMNRRPAPSVLCACRPLLVDLGAKPFARQMKANIFSDRKRKRNEMGATQRMVEHASACYIRIKEKCARFFRFSPSSLRAGGWTVSTRCIILPVLSTHARALAWKWFAWRGAKRCGALRPPWINFRLQRIVCWFLQRYDAGVFDESKMTKISARNK